MISVMSRGRLAPFEGSAALDCSDDSDVFLDSKPVDRFQVVSNHHIDVGKNTSKSSSVFNPRDLNMEAFGWAHPLNHSQGGVQTGCILGDWERGILL